MTVKIIAVGNNMPQWVETACNEYLQRLKGTMPTEIITCATKDRKHKNSIAKANRDEAAWLEKQATTGYTIALDRCGKEVSTIMLAKKLDNLDGQNINFLIGGPEGISSELLEKCDAVWSMSKLTFAHPVARVVLLEQLFRAWAINNNHPYHR